MARILIVEDDKQLGDLMVMLIEGMGHEVELATTGLTALELLRKFKHDVVFTDVHMAPMDGLELVDRIKETHPESVFIFISGDDSPELEAQGMRLGAVEFLHKPLRVEQLKLVMRRALSRADRERAAAAAAAAPAATTRAAPPAPRRNSASVETGLETFFPGAPLAGLRTKMAHLAADTRYALIDAAPGMLDVEVLRYLHTASPSGNLPLVVCDPAAEPITSLDSLLASANEGTLVILNIESLPAGLQKELADKLRQPRQTRIMATTAKDPDQLVVDGKLVGSLYSRLAVGALRLPPLTDFDPDIATIFVAAMRQSSYFPFGTDEIEIDADVKVALSAYAWPENLTELFLVAARAVELAKQPRLTMALLPDRIRGGRLSPLSTALRSSEAAHIERALRIGGTPAAAAELLGISEEELETYRKKPDAESLFLLKRDLSAPIQVPQRRLERVLIIAADELIRNAVQTAIPDPDVEVVAVADGLAAVAILIQRPHTFSAAILISPLALFEVQELALELVRIAPPIRVGLLGGRSPDAPSAPFSVVAPSFRTASDIETVYRSLVHSQPERSAA